MTQSRQKSVTSEKEHSSCEKRGAMNESQIIVAE